MQEPADHHLGVVPLEQLREQHEMVVLARAGGGDSIGGESSAPPLQARVQLYHRECQPVHCAAQEPHGSGGRRYLHPDHVAFLVKAERHVGKRLHAVP